MTTLNGQTIKLLKDARAIIAEPENWTRFVGARDSDGYQVDSWSEQATCWCSIGALVKVSPDMDYIFTRAKSALTGVMKTDITAYNDRHAHAQVLAKWDEAIANLEAA